jgi:hypothetical protein
MVRIENTGCSAARSKTSYSDPYAEDSTRRSDAHIISPFRNIRFGTSSRVRCFAITWSGPFSGLRFYRDDEFPEAWLLENIEFEASHCGAPRRRKAMIDCENQPKNFVIATSSAIRAGPGAGGAVLVEDKTPDSGSAR